MPERLVIADASPLIGLAAAGAFDLLRRLFGRIVVTAEVRDEVLAGGELPGASELASAIHDGWIEVRHIRTDSTDLVTLSTKRRWIGATRISGDNMAIPDYQSIMLPLLELAGDNQVHRVRDAVDDLVSRFKLTEEERQELMPDGRRARFKYNVAWSRTYMKKAGLLEDPQRGEFRITARGRKVLAGKPSRIDTKLLQNFKEFKEFIGKEQSSPTQGDTDPKGRSKNNFRFRHMGSMV